MNAEDTVIGCRVSWIEELTNIWTKKTRKRREFGEIYKRVPADDRPYRVAVMPDSWKREGKNHGLIKYPCDLRKEKSL